MTGSTQALLPLNAGGAMDKVRLGLTGCGVAGSAYLDLFSKGAIKDESLYGCMRYSP